MGYTKQVYKRAGEELAKRRDAARELTEARAREIAAQIPEITRLQHEMADTARSVTKLVAVAGKDAEQAIAGLVEKSLTLRKRREELLINAGYPGDYLMERKARDKCGGGGYNGVEMCACFREILKKEAYAELGAVSQVKDCSFDNFSLDMYPEQASGGGTPPRQHMTEIYSACRRYANEFSMDSASLLLIGHTGLGKTHLSLAIAGAVAGMGFGVLYTPVQKLMDKLELEKFSYQAELKEQYARDIESVLSCDLLVLDDLGAEFITQFSASALYNIVNTRLVEARPTIINTNLEPAEIEAKYSPRMLSRLMGGYRALKFLGKDIRFVKKIRK